MDLLRYNRVTLNVDVLIEVADLNDIRCLFLQTSTEGNTQFSVRNSKLVFMPTNHADLSVPVETLPSGTLGLPTRLEVI